MPKRLGTAIPHVHYEYLLLIRQILVQVSASLLLSNLCKTNLKPQFPYKENKNNTSTSRVALKLNEIMHVM